MIVLEKLADEIASQLIEDLRHVAELEQKGAIDATILADIRRAWPRMIFHRLCDHREDALAGMHTNTEALITSLEEMLSIDELTPCDVKTIHRAIDMLRAQERQIGVLQVRLIELEQYKVVQQVEEKERV